MISLLKTAAEMERLEKFKNTAVECFGQSIASTEQNIVEFEEQQVARFRAGLRALMRQLEQATTPEQLRNIQGLFREALHHYKDASHEQIRRLRRDVDAAASALEEFAAHTASSGGDHEKELKQALHSLDTAASERLDDIRAAIRAASARILASFEQMQAANHLAIAQLKDEIRVLHQTIQSVRRSATAERSAPEAGNRQEIDNRLDELLSQNTSFCLILVVLRNLKMLAARHSPAVMEDALHSLQARLQAMVPRATVGRWTRNQFVVILDSAPGNAMELSGKVAQKMMEPYDFQEAGVRRTLSFQVTSGVVDHRNGADVLKFRKGLEKLSVALGAGS